jgi:transcriptional regulator with XRE-family HTH domain
MMTNNIKELRARRNLSQAQLAKLMGVTAATVSRYESGAREMTISVAQQLSTILRASLADVIGGSLQGVKRTVHLRHIGSEKVTAFDAEMIENICENNELLRIYQVEDNAMYPTASAGDLCVLRLDGKHPTESGLYAIEAPGGKLTLRRVRMDDVSRMVTLVADSDPDGKSGPYSAQDVSVFGRVVWLGRRY